jgi:5-methylthioribose kinase
MNVNCSPYSKKITQIPTTFEKMVLEEYWERKETKLHENEKKFSNEYINNLTY